MSTVDIIHDFIKMQLECFNVANQMEKELMTKLALVSSTIFLDKGTYRLYEKQIKKGEDFADYLTLIVNKTKGPDDPDFWIRIYNILDDKRDYSIDDLKADKKSNTKYLREVTAHMWGQILLMLEEKVPDEPTKKLIQKHLTHFKKHIKQ